MLYWAAEAQGKRALQDRGFGGGFSNSTSVGRKPKKCTTGKELNLEQGPECAVLLKTLTQIIDKAKKRTITGVVGFKYGVSLV